MKTGILEVLLVNAEGIKHTNLVGTPSYFVVVECGNQSQRSKISSGKHKDPWWNEKFIFHCKNTSHLKCRIMDKELFTNGGFVGETIIYIGGIISEASEKGHVEIKPAPYNVVLEDHSYRGQIKIGFKFTENRERDGGERNGFIAEEKQQNDSICGSITSIWRITWCKIFSLFNKKSSKDKAKSN